MAAAYGVEVTGVCGPKNVELVRSLGADRVIDYTQDDFTAGERRYDVILDNVGNRSLPECRRALTPTGTLILNSGTGEGGLIKPLVLSPFIRQNLRQFIAAPSHQDLAALTELIESGKLKPVIGQTFPLAETPAAPSTTSRRATPAARSSSPCKGALGERPPRHLTRIAAG